MGPQIQAIVWAQWRSLRNYLPRAGRSGAILATAGALVWYGLFCFGAVAVFRATADPHELKTLRTALPGALFLAFLYWQVMPILMASTGASLDLRKLLVYPIPSSSLFGAEVLLRLTTGVEILIVTFGAALGLLRNPAVPALAVLGWIPWVAFNLFLSAGVRDLLARLLAHKRFRELSMIVFVLLAAAPQWLARREPDIRILGVARRIAPVFWPWTAAGQLVLGRPPLTPLLVLCAWLIASYFFAHWQFTRMLSFDEAATDSSSQSALALPWTDRLFRLPGLWLPDTTGAIVEKELRSLMRSPRFRLVFLMGFSFGLLIWIPAAFGTSSSPDSFLSMNYLTLVSIYSQLLLGEVLIWNAFGFDRSAAQIYYLVPVPIHAFIRAKNLAAVLLVILEVTFIVAVCAIFQLPLGARRIFEAYAVALTVLIYLLAAGNLTSIYFPRPIDPAKSFRTSSGGRVQALLFLIYPLAAMPVGLAYLGRYALGSNIAFFALLAFAAMLAVMVYLLSLDSAREAAQSRKELFITALSQGAGPIGT